MAVKYDYNKLEFKLYRKAWYCKLWCTHLPVCKYCVNNNNV